MSELGSTWERDDLGGGRFRHTQYLAPVNYLDSGLYRPIATDWTSSGDGDRPHIVSAAPMIISSSGDGLRRFHPTRELDRYIEIGAPYIKTGGVWGKANLGSPTRIGNLLRWVTQPANMYIWMGGHYAKLTIRLKTAWRPEDGLFAFPVGISGLTRQGGTILRDGVPVMRIRAPHVEDANNPDDVRPIEWDFVQLSGQTYILFTLPFLETGKVWDIDPTLTLQPDGTAGIDLDVIESSPTLDRSATTALTISGAAFKRRMLYKFDFSSIPASPTLVSMVMSLWNSSQTVNAATYSAARILVANSGWVETANWDYAVPSTVRWAGDTGADGGSDAGCGVSGTDFSGTALGTFSHAGAAAGTEHQSSFGLVEAAAMIAANYGIVVSTTAVGNQPNWVSSDHATAAQRPQIVTVYTTGSPRHMMYYKRLRG